MEIRKGISSAALAAAVVIALIIGIVAGAALSPLVTGPVVTTLTRTETEKVTETVVETEVIRETVTTTLEAEMEMGMGMMGFVPGIALKDQQVVDDTIVINAVFLDKPGYVVIHQVMLDGKPGKVIGHSELLEEGLHENVRIRITDYVGHGELYAMLHYDDGDGTYNFPGPDKPVIANGAIVQQLFRLIYDKPVIAVSDQEVKDGFVIIDGLYLDKPGYVVIHLVSPEGKPGMVIGRSGLLVGHNVRIPVFVKGYEGQERLVAMLHYDDGDGEYEFPGPDAPVKIGDKVVLVVFNVS